MLLETLFPGLTRFYSSKLIPTTSCCLFVAIFPCIVLAQINRSERPAKATESETKKSADSPAKSSQPAQASVPAERTSRTTDRVERSAPASDRSNRGETTETVSATTSASTRGRYKKTREADDSLNSIGNNSRPYYSPYVLFPDVYGYSPVPVYIPYPYPSPTSPSDSTENKSRFYSIYLYCDDFNGVEYADSRAVFREKIRSIHTPAPIFRDKILTGWKNLGVKNYDSDRNMTEDVYKLGDDEPGAALSLAVRRIMDSWRTGDVEPLSKLLLHRTRLAIILNGNYQYSMDSGDFLSLTRTALSSATDLQFIPDHLIRKSDKTFVLTGRHLFKDKSGEDRTVYFSYVLQLSGDIYLISQLSTAPDRL